MPMLSVTIDPSTPQGRVKVRRAPKGLQYQISSVLWVTNNPENDGMFGLFSREIQDDLVFDETVERGDVISLFPIQSSTTIINSLFHDLSLKVKTKYLSVAADDDTTVAIAHCLINYRFVPLTKADAIWEFLTKAVE